MKITLPEIILVGLYDAAAIHKNKSVTKSRRATMFEIEIPVERGGISYTNGEAMQIDENLLITAKPGDMRHTKLPFKCYYIHMIAEGEIKDILMKIPRYLKISERDEYLKIFKELTEYYERRQDADELMMQSLILKLIHKLSRESLVAEADDRRSFFAVESTVNFISKNLTEDLSLAALAKREGFSPIHFHNLFKSATGKTLRDFVEEKRIRAAANLIVSTSKNLTEIAYECGFSSQAYFSFVFKRRMNMTPRQYAKSII